MQGMFAGADFNGAQIIAYNEGEVVYNNYSSDRKAQTLSEENIVNAIRALLEAKDDDGNRIFSKKAQWYAVYRVLNVYADYPSAMTSFHTKMQNLGFGEDNLLSYESIAGVNKSIGAMASTSPETWGEMKDKSNQCHYQYIAADFLMRELGIRG